MLKFFAEKMWVAFALQKLLTFFQQKKNVSSFCIAKATHIFSAKNFRKLYIESAKTVNEMTLNELVKLTTLWTTGPRITNSVELDEMACYKHSSGSGLFAQVSVLDWKG